MVIVPVNYLLLVTVLYSRDDLAELGSRLLLLHPAVEDEVVEDLSAARILHHQVQRLLRLYHLESKSSPYYGMKTIYHTPPPPKKWNFPQALNQPIVILHTLILPRAQSIGARLTM
jgi:hypothetical protein